MLIPELGRPDGHLPGQSSDTMIQGEFALQLQPIIIQAYLRNMSNIFVAFCGQVLLSRSTSTPAQGTSDWSEAFFNLRQRREESS